MLRHSKNAMLMTFVCFGIAKLECQKLNIIRYFFSISYMPMHDLLKRKYAKKIKSKKIKSALNMIASVYSRRCGSYRIYLKGDSPHQTVMIVCELKWFSHISNRHNMYTLMQSCNVFHTQHTTHNILCYSWYMCRYNVIWPSQGFTCVNVYSLNCLDLFLKYKIS